MNQSATDIKQEFLKFLIKHNQYLTCKNHALKTRISTAKERNLALSAKIQAAYTDANQSQDSALTELEMTHELAEDRLNTCDEEIHVKIDQLRKGNETIETRMKEEANRFRAAFQQILNRNDISVKPYHEVVAATEDLQRTIEEMTLDGTADKNKSMDSINKIEKQYSIVTKDLRNVEVVVKDLRVQITIMQRKLNDQFAVWDMDPTTDMKSEIERLSNEILELEIKLSKLE